MTLTTKTEHTLAELLNAPQQTLERIEGSDEPAVLTVDGEPRAVVLSTALFRKLRDELALAADVESIQRGLLDAAEGRVHASDEVFDRLHERLKAMKDAKA